jgi:hypothetical protein
MKINWGWKLAIVYSLFAAGILTLVFKARSEKVELVTTDYYAQELLYQKRIEMLNNARNLSAPLQIDQVNGDIEIVWPSEINQQASGKIDIYRPSDESLDKFVNIQINENHTQRLPSSLFQKGLYILKIQWSFEEKEFFCENPIMIE